MRSVKSATPARRTIQLVPPEFVSPQLTKLSNLAPAGDNWAHEIKFDGYRIAARIVGKDIRLLTRNALNWADKYKSVVAALAKLPVKNAYIDGEICVLAADGTTSFAALQAATDHKDDANLVYFAFDLLFLDGEDLSKLPLGKRKGLLHNLLRRAPKKIRYVDHVTGNGKTFLAAACRHDAEGIVSKRLDAPYEPGKRGAWVKVRCANEEEFVIVGYSNPQGGRQYLGALLLGYYTPDGKLVYAGRAGTGMDEAELKRLLSVLKPLEQKAMTVAEPPPRSNRFSSPLKLSQVHWVKPSLLAQVRYLTWTADGLLRQVVYLGLREDKPAQDVVRESPARQS